jgi:transposase
MPWMETNTLEERHRFVAALESEQWSMSELCERFGISRPTGYKWVARYRRGGVGALTDRSRAPQQCRHRTPAPVAELILAARREYGWGAKKLLHVLQRRHPDVVWPARSTVNDLLARHHLLRRHRRRPRWAHPGVAPLTTTRPNQVWPADFKGQFRPGDGAYCYPLTVTDHFSRSLLVCRGLASVRGADVRPVLRALFREVGLPEAIRTDNGAPFATPAMHGLSLLNVWWMQLGSSISGSRPPVRNKTARTNGCIANTTGKRPARRPRPGGPSSAASMRFKRATTRSGRTRPSRAPPPRLAGPRPRGRIPSASRPPTIPPPWKSGASAAPACLAWPPAPSS